MKTVDKVTSKIDNKGREHTWVLKEGRDGVGIQIYKGDSLTDNYVFSHDRFEEFFSGALSVRQRMQDKGRGQSQSFVEVDRDAGTGEKAEAVEKVFDSMSADEISSIKKGDYDRHLDNPDKVKAIITSRFSRCESVEKTREVILQRIYDRIGVEWFTSRDFKELYESEFTQGSAGITHSRWLQILKNCQMLNVREPEEGEVSDGRIKRMYRLSDAALEIREEGNGFVSSENEKWQRKKRLIGKGKYADM